MERWGWSLVPAFEAQPLHAPELPGIVGWPEAPAARARFRPGACLRGGFAV